MKTKKKTVTDHETSTKQPGDRFEFEVVQLRNRFEAMQPAEIGVLALSHYEAPRTWSGASLAVAQRLEALGMLEENPTLANQFRRTEFGSQLLAAGVSAWR